MDIYTRMQRNFESMMRCKGRSAAEEKKETPKMTVWIFREGRRPELTMAENTAEGFAKLIKAKDIEDITLSCGLAVICDADNWWSDGECTFAVGEVKIRGTVLVVGADDDGFKILPREALAFDGLQRLLCTA